MSHRQRSRYPAMGAVFLPGVKSSSRAVLVLEEAPGGPNSVDSVASGEGRDP